MGKIWSDTDQIATTNKKDSFLMRMIVHHQQYQVSYPWQTKHSQFSWPCTSRPRTRIFYICNLHLTVRPVHNFWRPWRSKTKSVEAWQRGKQRYLHRLLAQQPTNMEDNRMNFWHDNTSFIIITTIIPATKASLHLYFEIMQSLKFTAEEN